MKRVANGVQGEEGGEETRGGTLPLGRSKAAAFVDGIVGQSGELRKAISAGAGGS